MTDNSPYTDKKNQNITDNPPFTDKKNRTKDRKTLNENVFCQKSGIPKMI